MNFEQQKKQAHFKAFFLYFVVFFNEKNIELLISI